MIPTICCRNVGYIIAISTELCPGHSYQKPTIHPWLYNGLVSAVSETVLLCRVQERLMLSESNCSYQTFNVVVISSNSSC